MTLSIDPYSADAVESIPDFKEIAADALAAADVTDAEDQVWIGGETAGLYDTDQVTSRDQNVIMPVLLLIHCSDACYFPKFYRCNGIPIVYGHYYLIYQPSDLVGSFFIIFFDVSSNPED